MPRRHLTEWAAWAAHHEDWLSPEGEAADAARAVARAAEKRGWSAAALAAAARLL